MLDLFRDLRQACRTWARRPGLAIGILLTLALGLGATTAILAHLLETFWWRFPAPDAERLVWVSTHGPDGRGFGNAYLDWQEYRAGLDGIGQLEGYGAYGGVFGLPGGGTSYGFGLAVSEGHLDLHAARPILGRALLPEDFEPGSPPVVLLDHVLWQRRMGGDEEVVGKTLKIGGVPFTVVGVLQPGFQAQGLTWRSYIPLPKLDEVRAKPGLVSRELRLVFGLLKLDEGVELAAARARLEVVATHLDTEHSVAQGKRAIHLRGVNEPAGDGDQTFRQGTLAMTAGVALLLLLATANVANLLIARAAGRRREIAIHAAVGAGRWRLTRRLLSESLLLAVLGAALGLPIAQLLLRYQKGLMEILPVGMSGWAEGTEWMQMDARVLALTLGVALLTGALFGLAPILHAVRDDLVAALKDNAGPGSKDRLGRRIGARQILVVAQVSLATVLLLGAGLLARSFYAMAHSDPGFDAGNSLLAALSVSPPPGSSPEKGDAYRRQLYAMAQERVAALPNVESATLALEVPGSGFGRTAQMALPENPEMQTSVERMTVSPGFFEVFGVPIVRGRGLDARDRTGGPGAVVVNEAFVATHLEGREALGSTLRLPDLAAEIAGESFHIVGVAADVHHASRLREPEPVVWLSTEQFLRGSRITLTARTVGDPRLALTALRDTLHHTHPDLAVIELATYDRQVAFDLFEPRLYSGMASIFATFGLALACLGIFSVMRVAVTYRWRELGIRMAVGATARDLVHLVMREAALVVSLGVAVGLAGALGLGRLLASLLHGIEPHDPATFAAVATGLITIGLGAAWLPAWRAGRVDPKAVLRDE